MTPTATASSRPSQNISITTGIKQKTIRVRHSVACSSVPSYFSIHPLLAVSREVRLLMTAAERAAIPRTTLCVTDAAAPGATTLLSPTTPKQFHREPYGRSPWKATNGHKCVGKTITQYVFDL